MPTEIANLFRFQLGKINLEKDYLDCPLHLQKNTGKTKFPSWKFDPSYFPRTVGDRYNYQILMTTRTLNSTLKKKKRDELKR